VGERARERERERERERQRERETERERDRQRGREEMTHVGVKSNQSGTNGKFGWAQLVLSSW
jgi:hypothetical protein